MDLKNAWTWGRRKVDTMEKGSLRRLRLERVRNSAKKGEAYVRNATGL